MDSRWKLLLVTSRPIFWLGTIPIYYGGVLAGGTAWGFLTWWGLWFVTFPLSLIIFGLNDIADIESDAINARKGGIEGNVLQKKNTGFIIQSIILVAGLSLLPFWVYGRRLSLFIIFSMYFLAYAYSLKPWRLKSRPFLDSLSNAFGVFLVSLLGFSHSAQTVRELFSFPFVTWMLTLSVFAVHAMTTLIDYDVDKRAGDLTTGGFLGIRWTSALVAATLGIVLIATPLLTLSLQIYVGITILLCSAVLIKPHQTLIYWVVWFMYLAFLVAFLSSVIFEYGAMLLLLHQ